MANFGRSFLLTCVLLAMSQGALAMVNPSPVSVTAAEAPSKASAAETLGNLPLAFIENRGQADRRIKFYAKVPQASVYFTCRELVLGFPGQPGTEGGAGARKKQGAVLRLIPEGLSPRVRLKGQDPQEHLVNYWRGNDPRGWRTGIPTFRAVTYQEAYPGIDLHFYGSGRALEYDIIVRPGSNPGQVRFHCFGATGLAVTAAGDLAITLPGGISLVHRKPLIYQEINGVRVQTEGRYKILGDPKHCRYGFQVAAYDRQHPLIIDPILDFSSFLGGAYADYAQAVAVDRAGNIYVAGYTTSWNFPICLEGSHLGSYVADDDAFVTKIRANGSGVVYSALLGGSGRDEAHGVAVDSAGNTYVTGFTGSTNFPPAPGDPEGPLYTYQSNGDAFVAKINAAGNALVFSTYLGGHNVDFGRGIAVDGENNIYVTGYTSSPSFPTWPSGAPLRPFGGNYDAFVTKINAGATALLYSTFLGGSGNDRGYAMAVDSLGNAYVTGETDSDTTFPTWPAGAPLLNYSGDTDAFVTKIKGNGSALVYSTFLGGTYNEIAYGLAVDRRGSAYIAGFTSSDGGGTSTPFPQRRAMQDYAGGSVDTFVARIAYGADLPWLLLLWD